MATDETTTSKAIDVSPSAQRPATAAEQRAKEHAGTTDTEVLARDIAQTREELSVTIDAIVDRVSPKKVVERGKQQAREGVQDATDVVKVHATTAAGIVREKALVASEVVQAKVAEVKEKVSGTSDATPVRSPLAPATSVSLSSATPVTSPNAGPVTSSSGPSPLPRSTVSVDAGEVPPPEVTPTTGSELPSHRPVPATAATPVPPVYAGAAALLAAVLLLLRRRRRRARRNRVVPGRR